MATVHLISGLPCSGKTTYSRALRSERNGVHIALDSWLITAFGAYSIESVGHLEHVRRVLACREFIWRRVVALIAQEVDAILDDGFFFREDRKKHINATVELGAQASIHYLRAPAHLLRRRVTARNLHLPRYNFRIDPGMLDVFISLFEVPSMDEGAPVVFIDAGEGA